MYILIVFNRVANAVQLNHDTCKANNQLVEAPLQMVTPPRYDELPVHCMRQQTTNSRSVAQIWDGGREIKFGHKSSLRDA